MARGCTRIAFEFEGYATHANVHVVAMVDDRGEFIHDTAASLKRKPDDEKSLGDLLNKAAEVLLDRHLPQWRENEGADGHLTVTIKQAPPDRPLALNPRGHATVRKMTLIPTLFSDTRKLIEWTCPALCICWLVSITTKTISPIGSTDNPAKSI